MSGPIVVLKFGSSVLSADPDFAEAVHEIYRFVRQGFRVVAVASAVGTTTERLLARARAVSDRPSCQALATLLATGEIASASLLAIALDRAGVPGTLLDPGEIGLRAEGHPLESEPCGMDAEKLVDALESHTVAVVPGFFGRTPEGAVVLFGRGGSDLTAIAIAGFLNARCRLLKDVDGIYDADPAQPHDAPARYESLTYDDALRLRCGVVQEKALQYAARHAIEFEVAAAGAEGGTLVGPNSRTRVSADGARYGKGKGNGNGTAPPLRVTILGLGTVGLAVYRSLSARPDRFDVVAVAVRDRARHSRDGVPPQRLHTDPARALGQPADIVVEAMGGLEPAGALLSEALDRGRHVVTANKELVAKRGDLLAVRAALNGRRFLFSSSVGGGVPVLETVARLASKTRITSIEGILNGTSNFVLDRLTEGVSLVEAVAQAQRLGLAEADPSADLDGTDIARKLVVLARTGFGVSLPADAIPREGIDASRLGRIHAARRYDRTVRLLAVCRRRDSGIEARVRPVWLAPDHPFARCRGDRNAVRIECEDGSSAFLEGRGAGAWPTAESLVADLLDLWRDHAAGARCPNRNLRAVPDLFRGENPEGPEAEERVPARGPASLRRIEGRD
jgi:homoserine dehydrogenase